MKANARVVSINKEMAQKLLDRVVDDHQRSRSEATIKRYWADMDAGNWIAGAAIIVLDHKDRLINGQHVLAAFIRSNLQKLEVVLQTNPNTNAIYGYDHGRKRSLGDDLKWEGLAHGSQISGVAVVLWQYERGFYKGTGYSGARTGDQYPTAAQVREIVRMHPGLEAHIFDSPDEFRDKGVPIAALRAALYLFHQEDAEAAKSFKEMLVTGLKIPSLQHPVAVLRKSITKRPKKAQRLRNGECLAWAYKAWYAYLAGGNLKHPIMRPKEPFPVVLPPEPKKGPGRVN